MALQDTIAYRFSRQELLQEALTHPSAARDEGRKNFSNQRLEFLGDAVLGLVVAELLYRQHPGEAEGELARRHSGLVCGDAVMRVARSIGLGNDLILSASEAAAGGRDSPTHLEDACEALIGAIYVDGGFEAAKAFVLHWWQPLAEVLSEPPKDAKSSLQEWAQARGLPLPVYSVIASEGPAHAPTFEIEVSLPGREPIVAKGASKRTAEHLAAQQMLRDIQADE